MGDLTVHFQDAGGHFMGSHHVPAQDDSSLEAVFASLRTVSFSNSSIDPRQIAAVSIGDDDTPHPVAFDDESKCLVPTAPILS